MDEAVIIDVVLHALNKRVDVRLECVVCVYAKQIHGHLPQFVKPFFKRNLVCAARTQCPTWCEDDLEPRALGP